MFRIVKLFNYVNKSHALRKQTFPESITQISTYHQPSTRPPTTIATNKQRLRITIATAGFVMDLPLKTNNNNNTCVESICVEKLNDKRKET